MKLLYGLFKKHVPSTGEAYERIIAEYVGDASPLICDAEFEPKSKHTEYSVRLWDGDQWHSVWASTIVDGEEVEWGINREEYNKIKTKTLSR